MKHLHALATRRRRRGDWNGFNVLHDAGGTVAALDLGFVPSTQRRRVGNADAVAGVLARRGGVRRAAGGVRGVPGPPRRRRRGARRRVLPGAAYTEKPGTYVNTEGRAQRAMPAVAPHGQAQEDWKILRALSEVCGAALPYDDLAGVRARLAEIAPHFRARGRRRAGALAQRRDVRARLQADAKGLDDADAARVVRRELLHDGCHLARVGDDGEVHESARGRRAVTIGVRRARWKTIDCILLTVLV